MAEEPVRRVVELLTASGYRPLAVPLSIGGSVDFDFAAILIGEDSLDLIVVIDTVGQPDSEVTRRQVEGLGRALDLFASRRPLTTILVGPTPNDSVLGSLTRVARVLPVGSPLGDDAADQLGEALAVLLPLNLPPVVQQAADSWTAYTSELVTTHPENPPEALLAASTEGSDAVEAALSTWVREPLDDLGEGS